jgi:hypothetical protein
VRALLALAMLSADPASAAALLAVDGAYNRVRELAAGADDEDEKAIAGDLAAALAPLAALAAGAPKK